MYETASTIFVLCELFPLLFLLVFVGLSAAAEVSCRTVTEPKNTVQPRTVCHIQTLTHRGMKMELNALLASMHIHHAPVCCAAVFRVCSVLSLLNVPLISISVAKSNREFFSRQTE
jgi:hypothetical protein